MAAARRDGDAGFCDEWARRGFRQPTEQEARTLERVARRDRAAIDRVAGKNPEPHQLDRARRFVVQRYAQRVRRVVPLKVVTPLNRNSDRRRRESHGHTATPTRGSPDDGEGEHSPSAVGEPARTSQPETLGAPLRALHARLIARSAAVDSSTVAEYAERVTPYLRDEPELLRDFRAAVETAELDALFSLERAA
jgi:hypothetical protein